MPEPVKQFFIERQRAQHHGDRIYFQAHPERNLSIADAVELMAQLGKLLDDDELSAVGKRLSELRPVRLPQQAPSSTLDSAS
jgi:hypothetical protein